MNTFLEISIGDKYNSSSQKARVITENWVKQNAYCPRCGNQRLDQLENNKPVSDFICSNCGNIFESKAKQGDLGRKIVDGAYSTMIRRINEKNNPDFLFMNYSIEKRQVNDFLLVPKHFFVDNIIEKRKPLSDNARRAGWTGCNILIEQIPDNGRIYLVKNKEVSDFNSVCSKYKQTEFVVDLSLKSRGWIMDVMSCINNIHTETFTIEDMYKFELKLKILHPDNYNIRPKIRQQMQILRDRKIIEFLGKGVYRKV